MEIWKDIPEYEELYEISNLGRVKSKTRKTKFGRGWKVYESQILKPQEDKDGYFRIALSKDGKKRRFFIHRLVMMSFVDNSLNLPVVNHIDGNKQNNKLNNLEWVTRSENDLHAFRIGLRVPSSGGTDKTVEKIDPLTGEVVDTFQSITLASKSVGSTVQLISMACNGKVKKLKVLFGDSSRPSNDYRKHNLLSRG